MLARGPTECDINNSLAERPNRLPEGVIWSSSPTGSPEPNNGLRPEQTEEERRPDGTYRHPLFISHTSSPLVVSKNEDVTRGKTEFETVIYSVSASAKTELQTPSRQDLVVEDKMTRNAGPRNQNSPKKIMTRNAGPRMTKKRRRNGGPTEHIATLSLYHTPHLH